MAATPKGAIIGRFSGTSVAAAFKNPQSLDLVQVIDPNDGSIIYNIDSTGTAHDPAVSPTPHALIGRFSGNTLAAAFSNPSQLDLLQVIKPNDGSIDYYVNYLGVSFGT